MIRSLLLAALAVLAGSEPEMKRTLNYGCHFNRQLPDGWIYGGYQLGPDGEVLHMAAGWKFRTGPAFEDVEVTARMVLRAGGPQPASTSYSQNIRPAPPEAADISIRPSAGGAFTGTYIRAGDAETWRAEGHDSYGRSDLIAATEFNEGFWNSDRLEVEIVGASGAVLLHKVHRLPAREARVALMAEFARLDAARSKRDFTGCKAYDPDAVREMDFM